jgi:hypothetical protein
MSWSLEEGQDQEYRNNINVINGNNGDTKDGASNNRVTPVVMHIQQKN